ncbi:MAG TPA: UDP-N-acetylmuramoyl-L-alanyl-D-glutamate--2,6-diaminopimelate ligase [Bacteroidetes bacterium]|nr:UDP-N-acetylmuramoyl-L-alanyl-D-glutamate--2,6-diaminopimelate ligase [Bacteroidota bacterium]
MIKIADIEKIEGIRKILSGKTDSFHKIEFDSRRVEPGDFFVAVRGIHTDGHHYIDEVVGKGVAGVCCEVLPGKPDPGVTWVQVENSAIALGEITSIFFGEPSKKFRLVGVTGTNGKTSVATSLYNLFRLMGYKVGLFSTTGIMIEDKVLETIHTTPDALVLQKYMGEMAETGCAYVFMEVSSHAVDQERIAGLHFAGGIFTNLTQDHLDYHKDFKSYLYAKKKFFDRLPAEAFALINLDDRNARIMVQNTKARVSTFGIKTPADFHARILESHFDGTLVVLDNKEIWIPFVGDFSVSNMTAVYSTAVLLGEDPEKILENMSRLPMVPGRFEVFYSPEGIIGIVDYAHTPDAVAKVLKTIRRLGESNEKVITVVGAGGNRDKTKRPRMARFAYDLSDILILTSDNPRDEEPEKIIHDMLEGLTKDEQSHVISIPNRKEAIKTAFLMAKPSDIVLVAGKGHETYQEIRGVRYHFDDREELKRMMNIE